MKKTYIALVALFTMAACVEKNINLASRVSISQTEDLEIGAEDVAPLTLGVESDGDWLVVVPEWIDAAPRHGSGDGTVTLRFSDNYTDGEMNGDRTGVVSVECASGAVSFTVSQAGDPMKGNAYRLAASVSDGKTYLLVVENAEGETVAAQAIGGNYGYLYVDPATLKGDSIAMPTADNGWLFTATDGGYTIQQVADGRYLYQTGSYNSFNVSASRIDGDVWTVTPAGDGTFFITNVAAGKWIQYSLGYKSFGSYPTEQDNAVRPRLYEKVENQ